MEELRALLLDHLKRHPLAQIQDAVKYIYQNEFGGGHLIDDVSAGLLRLERELDGLEADPSRPLSEPLGGGLCRLDLYAVKGALSPGTIFEMFLASSSPRGSEENLLRKLELLYDCGFPSEQVDAYLDGYRRASFPQVSHSDDYRRAYSPAYRVVSSLFPWAIRIFCEADGLLASGRDRITIGIDGMCASGKSTLASLLAQVYSAALFHADDYFLPPEKRTPERLNEPGGNMERERLEAEVLLPLSRGDDPVVRRFDCSDFSLSSPEQVHLGRVNIVEGSYSLHPELRDYYDIRVFLSTSPQIQLSRLAARNPERLQAFKDRWIPMENAYFRELAVPSCADIRLTS